MAKLRLLKTSIPRVYGIECSNLELQWLQQALKRLLVTKRFTFQADRDCVEKLRKDLND